MLWALPRGIMSVSGPSSASLTPNFVPQSAWNPPGFIAAKLLLGLSDQVGFVIAGVTTALSTIAV